MSINLISSQPNSQIESTIIIKYSDQHSENFSIEKNDPINFPNKKKLLTDLTTKNSSIKNKNDESPTIMINLESIISPEESEKYRQRFLNERYEAVHKYNGGENIRKALYCFAGSLPINIGIGVTVGITTNNITYGLLSSLGATITTLFGICLSCSVSSKVGYKKACLDLQNSKNKLENFSLQIKDNYNNSKKILSTFLKQDERDNGDYRYIVKEIVNLTPDFGGIEKIKKKYQEEEFNQRKIKYALYKLYPGNVQMI